MQGTWILTQLTKHFKKGINLLHRVYFKKITLRRFLSQSWQLRLYLFNSVRILHASTFPDVHLCGVNTSRLQKKKNPRKTMSLHQHYLRMRIRWVSIISHRQEVCMWDLPQVCGHPRKLSLGCPGSSFQFYPFSCQSCRVEQSSIFVFNNNEAQNRLSLQCTL